MVGAERAELFVFFKGELTLTEYVTLSIRKAE